MIKISRNNNVYIKYAIYSIMLILMALARTREGIAPFHIGLYAALLYSRQNAAVLAPLYLMASMLAVPTLDNLILSVAPPLIFSAVYLLHRVTKYRIRILHVMLYCALAEIPQICLAIGDTQELIYACASVVLSAIFTYISSIALGAVLIKGVRYNFATDEIVGLYAIIIAASMGLFTLDIFGFKPFYIVATLITLFAASTRCSAALLLPLAMGLGAGAFNANILVMAGLIVSSVFAAIFAKNNIYFSSIAYVLGDLVAGMFFNAFGAYSYLHIIAVVIGAVAYMLLPNKLRDRIYALISGGETCAVRAVIKRSRDDNAQRLLNVSNVFGEIADHLYSKRYVNIKNIGVEEQLSNEVELEVCAKCPNYNACSAAMGGNAGSAFTQLVAASLSHEVGSADVTPFLSSRCPRINSVLSKINEKTKNYKEFLVTGAQISVSRIIVSEQMRGLQEILQGVARNIGTAITFDSARERRIIDELRFVGITATQVICESLNGWRLLLVVRSADANKAELVQCVSETLKCPLEIVRAVSAEIEGFSVIEMVDKPMYDITIGIANMAKDGNEISGDTYSCGSIGQGKYIAALTDGMGSGNAAHYNSCSTISMVENYYRAGFDNNIILSLINRILAQFNKESFTCLDMAVIDLREGMVDFIKLGGVDGILLHLGEIEIIQSGALPMGIVEEAEPSTSRKALADGDIIVLMSDGVSDILGIEGVGDIVKNNRTANMQVLSKFILDNATKSGAADDSTVICAKIYKAI